MGRRVALALGSGGARGYAHIGVLQVLEERGFNPPDVLVSVPSDACRTMDFHRANEMIALGRELTEEALDDAAVRADG